MSLPEEFTQMAKDSIKATIDREPKEFMSRMQKCALSGYGSYLIPEWRVKPHVRQHLIDNGFTVVSVYRWYRWFSKAIKITWDDTLPIDTRDDY